MRPELWDIENEFFKAGYNIVAGVDEAGRGPLAGDVYASAVILPKNAVIKGLDDSKKLSEKRRNELFDIIINTALCYFISSASVFEIEEHNILGATFLAMNRAIEGLKLNPEITLIDGNRNSGITHNNRCFVGGDSKSASIAAASILAKVSRDMYMKKLAIEYPGYGFERNKGYGTKEHISAVLKLGATPVHRSLFLRKIYSGGHK